MQAGGDYGVFGLGFFYRPQRQPVPAHEFGDGFAHGKGGGEVAIEDLAGGVLAFFGVARGDDAGFAVALFGGGAAAFFYVVQQGGGKQDVLRLFVQFLIFGQPEKLGSNHFGVGQHVAFAVPFGILRHGGHVGKPVKTGGEGVPVGGAVGGEMGELPHGMRP